MLQVIFIAAVVAIGAARRPREYNYRESPPFFDSLPPLTSSRPTYHSSYSPRYESHPRIFESYGDDAPFILGPSGTSSFRGGRIIIDSLPPPPSPSVYLSRRPNAVSLQNGRPNFREELRFATDYKGLSNFIILCCDWFIQFLPHS